MTLALPTGMLDKCILSQAHSLSISTSLLPQPCSIVTTIQGLFHLAQHIISVVYPCSFHRNRGRIRWRCVSIYFVQVNILLCSFSELLG